MYRNGQENITTIVTDVQNLTTTSVDVNNIVAGITYTFSINATNSRGSQVVNCNSVTIGMYEVSNWHFAIMLTLHSQILANSACVFYLEHYLIDD